MSSQILGVSVIHGLYHGCFDVKGHHVEKIHEALSVVFNLPPLVIARANGIRVRWDYELRDGDVLEFVFPWGRKGAIDIFSEQVLPLPKAARRLPVLRGAKSPHPFTLSRWASKGRKSAGGNTVYLETCKVGGTVCTSVEALRRFIDRLNDVERCDPPKSRSQEQMEQQAEQAKKRLMQKGLLRGKSI